MLTFGERLNYLRKKYHITADNLANAIGIKRRVIFSYEKNDTKPSYDVLLSLSNYFGVSIDYLTARYDNPQYENFYSNAEIELLKEIESIIAFGENSSVNSIEERFYTTGNFMKNFYNFHRKNYTAPLAIIKLIFATREFGEQHLNPKKIKVHLVTPKSLQKANILLNPTTYLKERGILPETVLDIHSLPLGEKTPVEKLVEELDILEKEYISLQAEIQHNP